MSSRWGSAGEWQIEQTPVRDFIFDGVSTPEGQFAIAQSGEILFRPTATMGVVPAWTVDRKFGGAVKGLLADAGGRVWISTREGVFRRERVATWVAEPLGARAEMTALATNGAVMWAGGAGSILMKRDGGGSWQASAQGRSGTITSVWVGPGQELLVGTDFMIDVAPGGEGKEAEVLASASVA